MEGLKQFKCADWGDIDQIENAQGDKIFKKVVTHWSKPKILHDGEKPPIAEDEASNCIYCLVRDHHRANTKARIVYIGITKDANRRFVRHHVAEELTKKRGQTSLSIGTVDFESYWRKKNTQLALNQLEHLLIWALWPELNDRKSCTLPGMGKNTTQPWHIWNMGFRFFGVMPRELVYPWMLVKPGRDRSAK
jgi:hypothetical protein